MKLYFLNGWKLYKGPCYNCTENDEGSEVTPRRKQYIVDTNDPQAFGSWKMEEEQQDLNKVPFKDLTLNVSNGIKDIVLMVNRHEGWELESSEINLFVDTVHTSNQRFDIM